MVTAASVLSGGDTGDMLDRARSHSEDEEEDGSDISDQSDDSLSTKSSRIVASSRRARTRSTSRHTRRGTEEERDREDAISFASRKSLNSRRQSQRQRQQRQAAAAAGNNRQALHPHTASIRSKRSVAGGPTPLGAKKYPQVSIQGDQSLP